MSDPNHYQKLGVDENSSFEEIQEARNRLVKELGGDRKEIEAVEASYDAILMDRLRLRQEGKIKVPDRIRFPERQAPEASTEVKPLSVKPAPNWLGQLLDQPSRGDILWPAGFFLAAAGIVSVAPPQTIPLLLALGIGCSIYFLNRKENKLGRAFLLTLAGLVVGVILGTQLAALLVVQTASVAPLADVITAWATFGVLWLVSSFLR